MAVTEKYTLSVIKLNGNSPVSIYGIRNENLSKGMVKAIEHGAGIVDPSWVSVASVRPMVGIQSTELAKVLGVTGVKGICIGAGQTYTSADFYWAQETQCAPRASGSNHFKVSMVAGTIVPTQLQAAQEETATLGVDFHASWDGTNNPLTFATGVALPSVATLAEQFTLGPWSLNGSALAGMQSCTIDFGNNIDKRGSDGEIYPTLITVDRSAPTITGRTLTLTALNTFGLLGTRQTSSDSIVYFRKRAYGAGLVADATTEHVSFTVDEGMITVDEAGGGNNEGAQPTVVLTPAYDGTNATLALSTATAIA